MGSDDRLESWKEIASYLNREVRTVQRWEKEEALPVHRHQHKRQGSVYAYEYELDAWLAARSAPRVSRRVWLLGTTLTGMGAFAVFFLRPGDVLAPERDADTGDEKVLLAVLPFENLSGDADQDYFADGLSEEMIAQLARIHPERLGVIAWTTARLYRDPEKSVSEIGVELGVDFIIEGGVRREENRIRVNARLVEASEQSQLWAESYDRELASVLLVQRELAQSVARRIRIDIAPGVAPQPLRAELNVDAYEAFLRGRQEFHRWSPPGLAAALAHFELAIAIDPDYALAYGWRAFTQVVMAFYGFLPPHDVFPEVKEAASKALAIDPTVDEARLALGWAHLAYDWEWESAEREFVAVLDRSPSSPMAHYVFSWFLTMMDRDDEAKAHIRRALELDPLNPYFNTSFGDQLGHWGRTAEALEQYRKTVDRIPGFPWPNHLMALMHAQRGELHEVVARERLYLEQTGESAGEVASLEAACERSGIEGFWEWQLRRLGDRERFPEVYAVVRMAIAHAQLGDDDAAFERLERAYALRAGPLTLLAVSPAFEPLRDDPRFEALIERIGLPH